MSASVSHLYLRRHLVHSFSERRAGTDPRLCVNAVGCASQTQVAGQA